MPNYEKMAERMTEGLMRALEEPDANLRGDYFADYSEGHKTVNLASVDVLHRSRPPVGGKQWIGRSYDPTDPTPFCIWSLDLAGLGTKFVSFEVMIGCYDEASWAEGDLIDSVVFYAPAVNAGNVVQAVGDFSAAWIDTLFARAKMLGYGATPNMPRRGARARRNRFTRGKR